MTRRADFTALRLDAQEAYRLGAVAKVVPPEQLLDAAMEEARIIAATMPIGIRMAKAALNLIEDMDRRAATRFKQTDFDPRTDGGCAGSQARIPEKCLPEFNGAEPDAARAG